MGQWNVWCKTCKESFLGKTDLDFIVCPRCNKRVDLPVVHDPKGPKSEPPGLAHAPGQMKNEVKKK